MSSLFSASRRNRKGGDVACIFVHAGAGYHSVQNETHHLAACNDAAKAAMAVMRGGGSAVDAVEIAIKVLEDREITNAGYGSNLAMDGIVECDAVVVDHFGRSGGAGAVAQIKNPVSLARLLLDKTTQTLSLRRVPPNLLVGQGATDFAYEHHIPVLPHDSLISPSASERWRRWKADLIRAETGRSSSEAQHYSLVPSSSQRDMETYKRSHQEEEKMRSAHSQAMLTSVWQEAQPISPPPSDDRQDANDISTSSSPPSRNTSSFFTHGAGAYESADTTPEMMEEGSDPFGPPFLPSFTPMPPRLSPVRSSPVRTASNSAVCGETEYQSNDGGFPYLSADRPGMDLGGFGSHPAMHMPRGIAAGGGGWHDGSSGSEDNPTDMMADEQSRSHGRDPSSIQRGILDGEGPVEGDSPTTPRASSSQLPLHDGAHIEDDMITDPHPDSQTTPRPNTQLPLHDGALHDDDMITDTVGAIAIDMYGNIACAASSGGIGMKHRGRIGPAALVGIGAAVIPLEETDPARTTVATVTSGTGEHMGTTRAAGVMSDRLYHSNRKILNGGGRLEECEGDDECIRGFIDHDFMGHPSVRESKSSGAIGILSVKKTTEGIYLYYGHNTDSFALASMHSDEGKPVCTMSRNKGNASIAQGGRAIRFRRMKG